MSREERHAALFGDISPEKSNPVTEPVAPIGDFAGMIERFALTFDWCYGSERVELASREDAAAQRKSIEDKFPFLEPTNWKIVREFVKTEMLECP